MRNLTMLFLLCCSSALFAQSPVSWSHDIITEGDDTYVSLNADVDDGWFIYSQKTNPDGPVPTEVLFQKNDNYVLQGDVVEHGDLIKKYDELFELDVLKYKDKVEFRQAIDFKSKSPVMVEVTYMCCDSEKCLPPLTLEFEVSK